MEIITYNGHQGPVWNTYPMSHSAVVFVECDRPHSPTGHEFYHLILHVGPVSLGPSGGASDVRDLVLPIITPRHRK